MLDGILDYYGAFLHVIAEFSAFTLELVGILIIIVGSLRALGKLLNSIRKKKPLNVVIDLGKALSLALEFKMGAEIIKTVIIHDIEELAILGVVIVIRALLAFIIHWEMKMERNEELFESKEESKEDSK